MINKSNKTSERSYYYVIIHRHDHLSRIHFVARIAKKTYVDDNCQKLLLIQLLDGKSHTFKIVGNFRNYQTYSI